MINRYFEQGLGDALAILDRCQMAAITLAVDDVAIVQRERCIGCALCVTTCDVSTASLRAKSLEEKA